MATAAASRFPFLTMAAALTLASSLLVATPAAADDPTTGSNPPTTAVDSVEPAGDESATPEPAPEPSPEPAPEPAPGSGDTPATDALTSTSEAQDEQPIEDAPADDTAPEDDAASDPAETPERAPDAAVEAPATPEGASGFAAAPPSMMRQGGVTLTWNGWDTSQGPRNPSEEAILNGYRGQTAGIATISTTDITPGELVTVTATYLGPESECRGNGYGAATIMWPGAVGLLDHGPKTGDIPSVSVIVNSDGTRIDWGRLRVGMTVSATFAAPANFPSLPSAHHFPNVAFRSSIWTPERCDLGQSFTMLLWAGDFLANPTLPENDPPQAAFSWTVGAPGTSPRDVTFVNESTDDSTVPSGLRARWNFGDGNTSTELDPVHRYEHPGRYDVVLTVTDQRGDSSTTLHVVDVLGGLVVNSSGDLPAEDPAIGCDTGGTIGASGAPECTLRAAIETANAAGGGEITFDIDGSPVIAIDTALPAITTPTTIDGTTQAGGWVEVDGVPGSDLLAIAGGPVSATGLALHDARFAIQIAGGSEHVLEGLRIGTDLAGSATGDTTIGVFVGAGGGTRVTDSTISADQAGVLISGADAVGTTTVEGNAIGATPAGAANGDVEIGVLVFGAPASIEGNLIRSTRFGVMAAGADAAGTTVTGNRVGTSGSTPFDDVGTGIVVEGIPDAVVTGNTVHASEWGGILVAGGVMIESAESGFVFLSPTDDEPETPTTGTGAIIDDNVITAVDDAPGIASWAGADELEVTGNTVVADGTGIELVGGEDHLVMGNTVGSASGPLPGIGIRLSDSAAPRIAGNTVFAEEQGIVVRRDGAGAEISGNSVTGDPEGLTIGIEVLGERSGVEVSGNTVTGAGRTGIHLDVVGGRVTANVVVDGGDGIRLDDGAGNEVRDNLIGATPGLGSVPGNRGTGIQVNGGEATILGNTVVGSGGVGIDVDADAIGTLRGNRIWDSTGAPIATTLEPLHLVGAIIADTDGERRTTLVVTGLPDAAGTIEVFANDSCGADGGEARVVTDIRRQTVAGRDAQVIQVLGSHDHFTITFTTADGRTGDLSDCVDRATQPDSDGDGSPDPLDALLHTEDDPSVAVIATTDEQLLVVVAEDGDIEDLSIIDDPAPSNHPAGWSLPYGTFSFRVTGLEPGGGTEVVLTTYFQDAVLAGTGYWKYGPPTPGAAPSWYDFAFDAESGTGATRTSADVPGLGYRVTYALQLIDGARGDQDGAANGSITDPGGPVSFAGSPPPTSILMLTDRDRSALSATGSTQQTEPAWIWTAILAVLAGAVLIHATRWTRRRRGSDQDPIPR